MMKYERKAMLNFVAVLVSCKYLPLLMDIVQQFKL